MAAADVYDQSPLLKEKVQEGVLPPADERLPETPYQIKTIGDVNNAQYGGTLNMTSSNVNRYIVLSQVLTTSLVDIPGEKGAFYEDNITPDILESYKISDDATQFTFTIRPGLKWSDGQPVTTEDVKFAYNNFLMNDKLSPAIPSYLKADGEVYKLEIVDDYTFKIKFSSPYGGFIDQLGTKNYDYRDIIMPAHYWKNYHPDFVSLDKIEEELKENELTKDEWWKLFDQKMNKEVGIPTLNPWMFVKKTDQQIELSRNPYFHMVDEQGNQLPYIDKIKLVFVSDIEIVKMKVVSGEINFNGEHAKTEDVALYKAREDKGNFKVKFALAPTIYPEIFFNLSHQDSNWKQVVNNIKFRKAVNMSIDREEMSQSLFKGFAEISQRTPNEYNPDEARKLLDEIGMDKKDNAGYRLGPDGNTFTIPFEICEIAGFEMDAAELVASYLEDIGIRTTVKKISFALWAQLGSSNKIRASIHWAGSTDAIIDDFAFVGELLPSQYKSWGAGYRPWYDSQGESGIEPDETIKHYFELFDKLKYEATTRNEKQEALQDMLDLIYEDILWVSTLKPLSIIIVPDNIYGLPENTSNYGKYQIKMLMRQAYLK